RPRHLHSSPTRRSSDLGGYAVKLSDDCPLDGRFEIGSMTKTMTGAVLASLAYDGTITFGDTIGRWLDAGQNSDVTLLQLPTHTRSEEHTSEPQSRTEPV